MKNKVLWIVTVILLGVAAFWLFILMDATWPLMEPWIRASAVAVGVMVAFMIGAHIVVDSADDREAKRILRKLVQERQLWVASRKPNRPPARNPGPKVKKDDAIVNFRHFHGVDHDSH